MAISTRPCGTTGFFPCFQEERRPKGAEIVLGHEEMPHNTKKAVSGLGIPGWNSLLVY
jgi:hypothetical protein